MDGSSDTGFAFGRWRVLPRRREILAEDRPVPLGGRAFDVLLALLEAGGSTVTTDELLARVWPGAVVEENNLRAQISGLRKALGPEGSELIVNVARRGYRFTGKLRDGPGTAATLRRGIEDDLSPRRTSIVVLPFQNLSADPGQDYFAAGMADELTTALSRFGWLFVIAHRSSVAFHGDAVDVTEVGRALGVRYAVLGSVRREGRIRIATRLVDTATAGQIWAERFDGEAENVFDLQDRVSACVVGAIEPRLRRSEVARARAKPTASLDAYDHYLRALWHLFPRTETNYTAALAELEAANGLDPDFALALALAGHCHQTRCVQGWAGGDQVAAMRLAEEALAKAPDDPEVLAHAALTLTFYGRGCAPSLQLVARAVELNPNLAFAWFVDGWLHLHTDQPEAAIERFARARRLSPLDPMAAGNAAAGIAQAHLLAGRVEAAVEWARRAAREAVDYAYPQRTLAAALAHAGRMEEARAAVDAVLRIEPGFTLRRFLGRVTVRDTRAVRQLLAGLRLAGLPEG